jgi:hypothetical protein
MSRNKIGRRREGIKDAPSDPIRPGLRNMRRSDKPFEPLTFEMGEPRVDLTRAAALAAKIEDEALIDRYLRGR